MINRGDITDEKWERLEPHLPPQKPKVGRPALDHRLIINGILWILRTATPWRDLPSRYGAWSTVASRFYRWRKKGLWDQLFELIQQDADARGELDWQVHYVDGTVIRAHQHAAGAAHSSAAAEALGRSQGGFSTKVHLRAEGQGKPFSLVLTPGQQHETTVFEQLLQKPQLKRAGRGRRRWRPGRVVGDKGYSSSKIRRWLHSHGIAVTIPRRRTEKHRGAFDQAIYRERNRVERLINRLKQFRRLATRYEKRADNYRAMWLLGFILLWL
jgi:transposase